MKKIKQTKKSRVFKWATLILTVIFWPVKDVQRRQKLTTDFFKPFELTILVLATSMLRKKDILTMFSGGGGAHFKGIDNKIIGFVYIQ